MPAELCWLCAGSGYVDTFVDGEGQRDACTACGGEGS